ncbi:hypothetical protein KAJ27_02785 [bacterium]|nr:hypothetical protein [bacterium]
MVIGNRIVPFISDFVDALDDVLLQQKIQKTAVEETKILDSLLFYGHSCYKTCVVQSSEFIRYGL